MKDKKKIIVPLLLAGVTATGVVSNINTIQQVQVQAEETGITDVVGAEIKVNRFSKLEDGTPKYTDTFNVGDKVYLPEVTLGDGLVDGNDDVKVVYKIKKDKKEWEPSKDANGYFFEAKYQGYYNVTIAVEKAGKVTTTLKSLSVFVDREDATIKLPTNSEYVIPAKMPKEQDGLKIPAPSVVYDKKATDGTTTEVEEKAGALTTGTLNVYLVTPTSEVALTLDSTNSYYAVDKTNLSTVGTYQIVYEYKNGDTVISRLESSFQVVDDYDISKIKLKMIFQSSMPTKANVNKDVSIPKVKVVDENVSSSDAVNAYVKVIVKNLKTKETLDVNYENFTFHPTEEGSYSVTYVSYISLFGENIKTNEVTPGSPIVVSDSEAPKIIPTYAYEFNADGEIITVGGENITIAEDSDKTLREAAEEKLVNRRVDIPSVAVKGVEFTIPAAYATDNFYKFSNLNDDIVITRTYRSSTGAVSTISTPANENAKITFNNTGNAEIRYKATDKKGNTLGEVVYDIVIYDSADDLSDGKTTLKLDVGTKLVSDREKTLTFAKPTATDTYDKNVDVKTYLIKGEYSTTATKEELTETNSDGKYVIDVADIASITDKFTIVAVATIDKTLDGTRTDGITTTKYHTVKILKAGDDIIAPELRIANGGDWNVELFSANNVTDSSIIADATGAKIDAAGYLRTSADELIPVKAGSTVNKAPFDQGSDILNIPSAIFHDNKDANLSISIEIKDRKGNAVSKVSQESIVRETVGTGYDYTVSGASFKLSSYGVYTVTFTAKDYAGNMVIRSYGIRVNDKTAPTITILDEDKFNNNIEVGEYFEVPTATLKKEGVDIDGTTRWEIYNKSAGAECTLYNNGFIPTSEGTFFIRYYGQDDFGNETLLEDSMFTITAKDTIAPTIELDNTKRFPANIEWAPETGNDYMEIDIPVAFATDKNRGQAEVVYTVTGPNNVKPTVTDNATYDYLKTFKATAEGKYTVVYSAIDEAGNESKIEKVICVGDCVDPTITWVNKDNNLPKEIKLNETYELKINDFLKLSDNKSTEAKLRENVTVTLTSPDGTTVTNSIGNNSGYKWEFTKTGNYTLKITVKDEVGNSKTETYTINVPADDTDSKKVSPVLGTVLVVLSVVVLGGVVVYFVASNKKKPGKKSTTKKK